MANDWLNSALNITQDILTMAKGYDEGNKAAVPAVATAPIMAPARVVPEGMTSTTVPSDSSSLLVLAALAGLIILGSLLSR